MSIKRVLVVFPTAWDLTQLEYCRSLWQDRFEIIFTEPTDEDCPWDFDILGFIDRTVQNYRGRIDGVFSSSDYPGATVAGAVAMALGLPGTPPASLLRASHKYYSRLLQQRVVPEAVPSFRAVDSSRPHQQSAGLEYPCFIKPVKGAFSMLAHRMDSREQLLGFLNRPQVQEYSDRYLHLFNALLQRYTTFPKDGRWFLAEGLLKGDLVTVEGFRREGAVRILGITDAVTHSRYGSFLRFSHPSRLSSAVQERMAAIAGALLRPSIFGRCCSISK